MNTTFTVKNKNVDLSTGDSILVFICSVEAAENWLYAAWQKLNPTQGGGSQQFVLTQSISVQATMPEDHHYESNQVPLLQGQYSEIGQLLPGSDGISLSPAKSGAKWLEPDQFGLLNNVNQAGIYGQWLVDDKLALQDKHQLTYQGKSLFELDIMLFFAVGEYTQGVNWNHNQISEMASYKLPEQTSQVTVELSLVQATYQWDFTPPSA